MPRCSHARATRGRVGNNSHGSTVCKQRSLDAFYSDLYKARWPALRAAMLAPSRKVVLWNRFCQLPLSEVVANMEELPMDEPSTGCSSSAPSERSKVQSHYNTISDATKTNVQMVADGTKKQEGNTWLSNDTDSNNSWQVGTYVNQATSRFQANRLRCFCPRDGRRVGRSGKRSNDEDENDHSKSPTHTDTPINHASSCAAVPCADSLIAKPRMDVFGIRSYYLMDYASVLVVQQLDVGPFDTVFDMCAAPGGKSVAVSQLLSVDGALVANEKQADRAARLRRTLREHVPANYVSWKVTQRDGQYVHEPQRYARVLVDAPCSSERHVLQRSAPLCPRGLDNCRSDSENCKSINYGSTSCVVVPQSVWSEQSSARLAECQCTLLLRALELCRVGGRVVYSTCSISPCENDGVVLAALRKTRCRVRIVRPTHPHTTRDHEAASGQLIPEHDAMGDALSTVDGTREDDRLGCHNGGGRVFVPVGEATKAGWIILPDVADGWGPMYFCILHKTGDQELRFGATASSSSSSDEGEDEQSAKDSMSSEDAVGEPGEGEKQGINLLTQDR